MDWRSDAEERRFGDEVQANSSWHLRRSRLFAGATEDTVERYAGLFALRQAAVGTTIALDDRANRSVHVIRRGRVRIERRIGLRLSLVVVLLGPGGVFGVETLFNGRSHAMLARCLQETMLLSAPSDRLGSILDESARISINTAQIMAESLDGIALALEGLPYAAVSETVYAALGKVSLEHGVAVEDGTLLDIALRPEDIAVLTRSFAGDVAMALFFLEREGRIRREGSLITLLARG